MDTNTTNLNGHTSLLDTVTVATGNLPTATATAAEPIQISAADTDQLIQALADSLGLAGDERLNFIAATMAQAQVATDPPDTSPPVFNLMNFGGLFDLPDPEYIVDGLITAQTIGMIWGEPGAGKSFVAIDWAIEAAIGGKLSDQWQAVRPLDVCYTTSEGKGGIKSRFVAAMNKRVSDNPDIKGMLDEHLLVSLQTPQMFDPNAPTSVDKFIAEVQLSGRNVDIVIIDTLNNASIGANENDTRDMTIVSQNARRISEALGCAVIFVHHSNKLGNYRGSSALHGAMDFMAQLSNTPNGRELKFTKIKDRNNDSPTESTVYGFNLQHEPVSKSAYVDWFTDEQNQVARESLPKPRQSKEELAKDEIRQLLRITDKRLTQSEIVERIANAGRNTTLKAIAALEREGAIVKFAGESHNSSCYQLNMDLENG